MHRLDRGEFPIWVLRMYSRQLRIFRRSGYLIDELQVAGHARDGLAARRRLPEKHGEVIRARR